MNFGGILISCLIGGTAFAAIAAWLTTKRGNTISDVLSSQHLKDAEAIKVEILDKIKIRSSIPIIGLYLIAATIAIGLPGYIFYLNKESEKTIFLQGEVSGKRPNHHVDMVPVEMNITTTGLFSIPLMDRTGYQIINFQSAYYEPLTLHIKVDKDKETVTVRFSNQSLKEERLKLDATRIATLQQRPPLFESAPAEEVARNIPSTPSTPPPTTFVPAETTAAPAMMQPPGR